MSQSLHLFLQTSIIRNFMACQDRIETDLLQLFAHAETSEWFSIISGIIFEVSIVAEREQALATIFLFFIKLHCPQLFYCLPCPTAFPASLIKLM